MTRITVKRRRCRCVPQRIPNLYAHWKSYRIIFRWGTGWNSLIILTRQNSAWASPAMMGKISSPKTITVNTTQELFVSITKRPIGSVKLKMPGRKGQIARQLLKFFYHYHYHKCPLIFATSLLIFDIHSHTDFGPCPPLPDISKQTVEQCEEMFK